MNNVKTLRLPLSIEAIGADEDRYLAVKLNDRAIPAWTLGLCLLRNALCSSILVYGESDGALHLEHDIKLAPQERAVATWDGKRLSIRVSSVELEYWISFYLMYFRDGFGAVSHIDVEAWLDTGRGSIDIIFQVERVGPAMSPQDLNRMLGKPE